MPPKCRVIIQARTSSSRLPGKGLLPIGGFPAAVLAVLRVSHPDWESVLATSDDPTDDRLAQMGRAYGLAVVRGPLDDVLARFVLAVDGLPDEAIVARLTADNVVPDARLVEEALGEFARGRYRYLITWTPTSDVPQGLTVELFHAGALREAAGKATLSADREHVTPWIRRAFGVSVFRPKALSPGAGRLRCTIDTLDDYLRVARAFDGVADPVRAPWTELLDRLERSPGTPRCVLPVKMHQGVVHSDLVLGTARLGREPAATPVAQGGLGSRTGTPVSTATELVLTAVRHRVTHIDTAPAYGASERLIGAALSKARASEVRVVTKLAPLDDVEEDASPRFLTNLVDASVFRSCRELRCFAVPALLVKRAADRNRWKGAVWRRLVELRDQGVIGALGVAVATPEEALGALDDPDVQHVQIPFNILDGRWKESGFDVAVQRRADVTVHARSPVPPVVLDAPWPQRRPSLPGVDRDALRGKLAALAHDLGRENLADLCFAYVRSYDWIHGVIAELDTAGALEEAVRLFNAPKLNRAAIQHVESQVAPERDLCPPSLFDLAP